jgi:hypothetical protein
MQAIVDRYQDKTTPNGNHKLKVDLRGASTYVWYLYWGEYAGKDDHHHFGIARITPIDSRFKIDWYRKTEKEPYRSQEVADIETVYSLVDAEIATR